MLAGEQAVASEAGKEGTEALVADAEGGAQVVAGDAVWRSVEQIEEARAEIGESGLGSVTRVDDVEAHGSVVEAHESEVERLRSWGGAVLDGEGQVIAEATEVEGAVGPGVEVPRSAEGLAGVCAETAFLGVMDDDDGDIVLALHLTQECEESGDFTGAILVDAM